MKQTLSEPFIVVPSVPTIEASLPDLTSNGAFPQTDFDAADSLAIADGSSNEADEQQNVGMCHLGDHECVCGGLIVDTSHTFEDTYRRPTWC